MPFIKIITGEIVEVSEADLQPIDFDADDEANGRMGEAASQQQVPDVAPPPPPPQA